MNSKLHILRNNLKLIVVPIPKLESVALTVWVKTGSRYEREKEGGISHFLEHMVFKGTKKRPSAKIISETIDSLGAEYNAGTSKEWTNFYIKARSGVIDKAYDLISDVVFNPLLKGADIERERGVILEEMAMKEDSPLFNVGDIFENVIYKNTSLGKDIIGTPGTVKKIQKKDFENYRNKHYFPENILVTVSGGVSEEKAVKLARKYFEKGSGSHKATNYSNLEFNQEKPEVAIKTKSTDQAHLIVGFRGDGYGTKDRYFEAVLSTILGGGMSSRIFEEVREKRGLAYAVKTSSDHYRDNGYVATYAGVRLDKTEEAIKVILDQYYGLASSKYKITNKELFKAKEYVKGHVALNLEDTININTFIGLEEIYLNTLRKPSEVYKNIDKVNISDVLNVAKRFFRPSNLNLAIIGPFKNKRRFDKLIS
jgi:predicted Zn-dependent peptidase